MNTNTTKRPNPTADSIKRKIGGPYVLAAILLLSFVVAGCANGTYPLDFFYEMHYQQSYSSHEPPRLSPPSQAVPITGKEVIFSNDEISTLTNPLTGDDGVRLGVEGGRQLFVTNCSMCHGLTGAGDGQVLTTMIDRYSYQIKLDPNLRKLGLPDENLFAIVTDRNVAFPGIEGWVMPQFRRLLTPEQRWMLVNYIRCGLQGLTDGSCPSPNGN